MPKFQEMMKLYKIHLQLCDEAFKKFNKKQWKNLIELEQNILAGIEKSGREVTNSSIIKGLTQISKSLT